LQEKSLTKIKKVGDHIGPDEENDGRGDIFPGQSLKNGLEG
jgi:hypothetical protein